MGTGQDKVLAIRILAGPKHVEEVPFGAGDLALYRDLPLGAGVGD